MGAFVRDANTFSQRVAPRGTNRREGAEQASDAPRSAAVDRRVEDDLRPHAHLVLAWCSTVLEGALAFKDPEEQSAHILAALSTRRPTAADTFVSVANGIIKDAKSALCSQQTSTTVGELQNTLIHAQIDIRSVREFFESTVDFQGGKISPCLWLCGVVQAVEEICSKLHEVRVAIWAIKQERKDAMALLRSVNLIDKLLEHSMTSAESSMLGRIEDVSTGDEASISGEERLLPITASSSIEHEVIWKHPSSPQQLFSVKPSQILPLIGKYVIDSTGLVVSINLPMYSLSVPETHIEAVKTRGALTVTLGYKIEDAQLTLAAPRGAKPLGIQFFAGGLSLSDSLTENEAVMLTKMTGGSYSGVARNGADEVAVTWALEDPQYEDLSMISEKIRRYQPPGALYSPLMTDVIKRNLSADTSDSLRAMGTLMGMVCDGWHYINDFHISSLYSSVPPNLRLSLMSGLRLGKCDEMSQYLHVALAQAHIPSVIEEGKATYREDTKSYWTPGHAQVRLLGTEKIVLDPTLRVSDAAWVRNLPEDITSLCSQARAMVIEKQPESAYKAGVWLRAQLFDLGSLSNKAREASAGQSLTDDFNTEAAAAVLPPEALLSLATARLMEYHRKGYWYGSAPIQASEEFTHFLKVWGPLVRSQLNQVCNAGDRATLEALPIVRTLRMLTLTIAEDTSLIESGRSLLPEVWSFANDHTRNILLTDFAEAASCSYCPAVHDIFSRTIRQVEDSSGYEALLAVLQFISRDDQRQATFQTKESEPFRLSVRVEIVGEANKSTSFRSLARFCLQAGALDVYPPTLLGPQGVTVRFDIFPLYNDYFIKAIVEDRGLIPRLEMSAENVARAAPVYNRTFVGLGSQSEKDSLNTVALRTLVMGSSCERQGEILALALETHLKKFPVQAWDVIADPVACLAAQIGLQLRYQAKKTNSHQLSIAAELKLTRDVFDLMPEIGPFATRIPLAKPSSVLMAEIALNSCSLLLEDLHYSVFNVPISAFDDTFLLLLGVIAEAPDRSTEHSSVISSIESILNSPISDGSHRKLARLVWDHKRAEVEGALNQFRQAITSSEEWVQALEQTRIHLVNPIDQAMHILGEQLLMSNAQKYIAKDVYHTLALDLLELNFLGLSRGVDNATLREDLIQLGQRYTRDEIALAWMPIAVDVLIAASSRLGYTAMFQQHGICTENELGSRSTRAARSRFVGHVLEMFQLRADTVAFHDASEHTTDLPESHSVSLVTARPTLRGEEGDRKRTQREKSFDREGLLHTTAPADPRSINWAATARVSSGVVVNTYAKSALKLPTHHHLLIDASSWILDPTADLSAWEYRHVERFDTAALSRLSSYIQTLTTSGKKVSVSIYVFGTEVASLDPTQTARWALERCILSDDWAPGASAILGSLVSPNQSASSTQHGFAKYFDALSYKARGACDAFEVARLYTLALQGGCAISLMRPSSLAGDGGFGINDLLLHARLARSGTFSVVEI